MDKQHIILLSGFHGAGKDTCADQMVYRFGAGRFAFGDAIKEMTASLFPWVHMRMLMDHNLKDVPVDSPLNVNRLTPRQVVLEVDKLRASVDPSMFTNRTLHGVYHHLLSLEKNPVIIPDVRFQHEVDAIDELVSDLKVSGYQVNVTRVLIVRDGVGPTPETYNQWIAQKFNPDFVYENNSLPDAFPIWLESKLAK